MHTLQRASLLAVIVLLVVTACVIPSITVTDPVAQATILAVTVDAAIRLTQAVQPAGPTPVCPAAPTAACGSAVPSATELQTASPTITSTLAETSTATSTTTVTPTPNFVASPTSITPMISVSISTNCRSGPGKAYDIEGALLAGAVAQVLGRDPTGNYWYIPNPDRPGDYCYVWGQYATITGYTGGVQMLTPPPTPLPTFTPTPVPGFDVTYEGLVGCSGSWWTRMGIENTSTLTFRSAEFILMDLNLDTEDSDESDGFVDRSNCTSSSSRVSLAPGDTLMISSPNLSNDPSGHRMRARVKLCTKTGLNGTCATEILNFKP